MPGSEDFDTEKLDADSENIIASFALSAIFADSYASSGDAVLPLMEKVARVVMLDAVRNPEIKSENIYNYFTTLKASDSETFSALMAAFLGFRILKESLKEKVDASLITGSLDECALLLTSLVFGYSITYGQPQDFWPYLEKNQKTLFSSRVPLSEENLYSIFSSDYIDLKFAMLNSGPKKETILYILKYTNVERLFSSSAPISLNAMKDSEIQSYRINGRVGYFYGFDPSILDCERLEVSGKVGFKSYPCNRVSIKPRDLQINQLVTDGPYSSGSYVLATDGVELLSSIKNSYYDASRFEEFRVLNLGSIFASYNSGWIYDELPGLRCLNFGGDIQFADNSDSFKQFPQGATGHFHFLGHQTFIMGTGVGDRLGYTGFTPLMLRLNNKDESLIYSGLRINLFDKVKSSGQLMAYALSTQQGILGSFSSQEAQLYPLTNISAQYPELPFLGVNLDFSSKTFNQTPVAKFNFGSLFYVPPTIDDPGGAFTRATDFSFTGFNVTGDFFGLSTGSIKLAGKIYNTGNFNPEELFTNQFTRGLRVPPQNGSMLLQKALGFSNYKDCVAEVSSVISSSHYGVPFKFIEGLAPQDIEARTKFVGDSGVLSFATGVRISGVDYPLLSKSIFGPLKFQEESLDGKEFGYQYLPDNYENGDILLGYSRVLNPARYYSGLFASDRRPFLYTKASYVHNKNAKKYFPHRVKFTIDVQETYSKKMTSFSRYVFNPEGPVNELTGEWVDNDFSHHNTSIGSSDGYTPIWSYNPLTNRNLNGHFQYLNSGLSISDGVLSENNLTTYHFNRTEQGDNVILKLPKTPLTSNLKEDYSFDIELNYNLPIKSLSDFLNYPKHSNKAFVSTGDSKINIVNYAGSYVTGWTEQINIDVNNGADPLFNTALDVNQNISGDSWNGFYLRSGTVHYPANSYPYRVPEGDKILVEASDNSSNLRLFLRNLKLFPVFVNNDKDLSYLSGASLVNNCFDSKRQKDNFIGSRVFEINSRSVLDNILPDFSQIDVLSFIKNDSFSNKIEKEIIRTGRLYYAPELVNGSRVLPQVSDQEYLKIRNFYPEMGGFAFYSDVDTYSRANTGHYLDYEEASKIKLTVSKVEVMYNRFPDSDELFEFYLTGKASFTGELSYDTQEESCVITHGMHLKEEPNEADEFQKMGYFFDYCSPPIGHFLNVSARSFPTKQLRRKTKKIYNENVFVPTDKSAPNYFNRFYVKTIPEFVYFNNQGSILGDFGFDHLINPNCSLVSSSSYDDIEVYDNGEVSDYKEISKKCNVHNNVRLYDAFFTNSLDNSGFFVQVLTEKLTLDINKENKTFYAPYASFICDLEAGPEKNKCITLVSDRGSDHNEIRFDNKPTGAF